MAKKSDEQQAPGQDKPAGNGAPPDITAASDEDLEREWNARLASRTPADPHTGPGRFRCVRRCHHAVAGSRSGTRRIYTPGEIYDAGPGETVPRHFVRVDDAAGEAAAREAITDEKKIRMPAYLDRAKRIEIGG